MANHAGAHLPMDEQLIAHVCSMTSEEHKHIHKRSAREAAARSALESAERPGAVSSGHAGEDVRVWSAPAVTAEFD
jgi:alkaline phosphatase